MSARPVSVITVAGVTVPPAIADTVTEQAIMAHIIMAHIPMVHMPQHPIPIIPGRTDHTHMGQPITGPMVMELIPMAPAILV